MAIGTPNRTPNQNPLQPNSKKKPRWADEDDGDLLLLPPLQVISPDKNGIKKVIEYNLNEDGNRVNKTSTIRVCKLTNTRLSEQALERRSWPKFEDSTELEKKANPTVISTEEVFIRRHSVHEKEGL